VHVFSQRVHVFSHMWKIDPNTSIVIYMYCLCEYMCVVYKYIYIYIYICMYVYTHVSKSGAIREDKGRKKRVIESE
jgi:hypothetical protein